MNLKNKTACISFLNAFINAVFYDIIVFAEQLKNINENTINEEQEF